MGCKDCLDGNCNGQVVSDRCVEYTGETIEKLGVCKGSSLSYLEAAIVEKLLLVMSGKGITLDDFESDCDLVLEQIAHSDKTLFSILQIIINQQCTLSQLINTLKTTFGVLNLYSTCIDLSGAVNLNQILQLILNSVCSIDGRVKNIENDYVKNTDLEAKVKAILSENDSSSITQWNLRMVPYVAYPYHGSLSNFDSNGVGYSSLGFSEVYFCNGSNGTPDYRGRSPMGANVNVPGNAMDSVTNPVLNNNSAYALSLNGTLGSFKDTLTTNQIPSHNHTVNDGGHSHTITSSSNNSTGGFGAVPATTKTGTESGGSTNSSVTNITLAPTGGGQFHNTTHPVRGCNFIMYIPQ